MGAQLESEIVLGSRRGAVSRIDFCDTLFVGVENETAPEDISLALTPLYRASRENSNITGYQEKLLCKRASW